MLSIKLLLDFFSLNVLPSVPPHRSRIIRTSMNGNNSNNKTNLNSSRWLSMRVHFGNVWGLLPPAAAVLHPGPLYANMQWVGKGARSERVSRPFYIATKCRMHKHNPKSARGVSARSLSGASLHPGPFSHLNMLSLNKSTTSRGLFCPRR